MNIMPKKESKICDTQCSANRVFCYFRSTSAFTFHPLKAAFINSFNDIERGNIAKILLLTTCTVLISATPTAASETDSTSSLKIIKAGESLSLKGELPVSNPNIHRTCIYNGLLVIKSAGFSDACESHDFKIEAQGKTVYHYDPDAPVTNNLPFIPTEPYGFSFTAYYQQISCLRYAFYNIELVNKSGYDVSLYCEP